MRAEWSCCLCFSKAEKQSAEARYKEDNPQWAPVDGEESQVVTKPKKITVREAHEEKQEDLAGAGWQNLADELEPAAKKAAATRELNLRLTNLGVLVEPDYGGRPNEKNHEST